MTNSDNDTITAELDRLKSRCDDLGRRLSSFETWVTVGKAFGLTAGAVVIFLCDGT
jgi:hypothetical protein